MEDIAVNWKPLATKVLQHIPEIRILYTPNTGGRWKFLEDSIVIPFEHKARTLITDILLMYNKDIVAVPSKLLKTLQDAHTGTVQEMTPLRMYEILRTHDTYKQLDRQKKLELLQYLLESESSDCLKGLHLLPLADESFAEFDNKPGQIIVFCQDKMEIELFPGLEKYFVSWNIPEVLLPLIEKRADKGINSLALMTDKLFPKFLAGCVSFHGHSGESCLSFPKPPLTVKWIEQVWNYISSHRLDVMVSLSTVAILGTEESSTFARSGKLQGLIPLADPQIRYSLEIDDIAFKAAVQFWNESEEVVDVPTGILESFNVIGLSEEIHSRYISVYNFFESVFLPHISDSYWSAADRDKLTMYAINSRDPAILELLKDSDCIPIKPSGKLKRPSELVHPGGQCAPLYTESDECFPEGRYLQGFQDLHVLKVLSTLGMVEDELPSEALLERTNSVISLYLKDPTDAIQRCWRIVKYISYTSYSSRELTKTPVRFLQYPDEIQQKLKDLAFLPVKRCPPAWHLPWKGDSTNLARPCDLFSEDVTNLVFCSEMVIDSEHPHLTPSIKEGLETMGLKHKSAICIDTVMFQLETLADEMGRAQDESARRIKRICSDVYQYLDKMCSLENPHSNQNKDIIRNALSDKKVVLVGDQMLYPEQVAFDQVFDLPPYLFKIGSDRQWPSLLETLGVKQLFSFNYVVKVVETFIADIHGHQLNDDNLKCYERLTTFLVDLSPDSPPETFSDRFLPDRDGSLKVALSLCFDDYDFVTDDGSMNFVHPAIHQRVAKWFGVRGKREANLKDNIFISHYFTSFGQSEALTSRLKRILSGYPCDSAIMKELLQNADDSGASELMFIKDFRSLPTEKVFCENWESIQGPALCVYNNSYFSEKDFEGIQNLGEGSKSNDPMKTGQYGVGFNAVYHLTDVPSFMTVGPGVEKTICALDPHMKYVPWATDKQPGGRIENLNGLRTNYRDSFDGYLEDCIPMDTKGTLFRFPLRTFDMANESKISNKEITTEKVDELLKQFKEQMFDSLLFLHSVKKITIARIKDDGSLEEEYHVECKMDEADTVKQRGYLQHLQTQANNVKDHSTGVGLDDISLLEAQLTLHIQDSKAKQQDWLVVHQSGFSREKEIPETLISSWEKGDIRLLPRGGVAVPLPSNTSSRSFHGKAFCILPLPIETRLPVHINGHFALDHEARRNLWHGGSDYRSDWNKHMVEALIIPAYISSIQALKLCLNCTIESDIGTLEGNLARYYSYFPDVSKDSDVFWRHLAQSFYSELVQRRTSLFSVIKPVQKVFSDFPKGHDKSLKVRISWVPVTVQRGFPGYFNNLEEHFKVEKNQFEKHGVAPPEVNKRFTAALEISERKKRLLSEILRDLNMKVIEAPVKIYHNFVKSEQTDRVLCVNPDTVLLFLKSHNDQAVDKCMVGCLPRNIEHTPFKNVATLKLITDFIHVSSLFGSNICGLPVAMTLSRKVCVFSGDEPLMVTKFTDLLMKTPNISIHGDLVQFYKDFTESSPSLKPLTIDTLTSLLPQLVDAELLNTVFPVAWDNRPELPTKEWIRCLWNYLEDEIVKKSDVPEKDRTKAWFRTQLAALEMWCLFPAVNGLEDCQSFLYPMRNAGQVINLFTFHDRDVVKALTKMKMHCLNEDLRNICVATKLTADWDNPETILFAISSMKVFACDRLTEEEAEKILVYFCKNIVKVNALSDSCELLRKLPFYPSFTDEIVPIEDAYIVEFSSAIPKDGLQQWISVTGKQLIKYRYPLEDLYKHMRVGVLQPLELYSQLLIPRFESIPYAYRAAHLKVIRDELLKKTEKYSGKQEDLINQLKNLPFIELQDGTLHRASEFHSHHEIVFEIMCPLSAFLPCPYNEEEWHTFLVLIGLQLDVTVEHFLTFANEVEQLGSFGISKEVEKKSTVLAKHLCESRPDKVEEGILVQIRDIKFLLPYNVSKMHRHGKLLTEIHSQYEEGSRLVCYSGSVDPSQCYISWTSSTMFLSRDNPAETEYGKGRDSAYQQLQTSRIPEHDLVVKHMQNICCSVTEKQNHYPLQEVFLKVFNDVLNAIYEYFQKQDIPSTAIHRLDSTNTIFLPDDRILVPAKQVVTSLSEDEVIPGYLYSGPVYFGKYFDVFRKLGAAEKPTANQFALVLNNLKEDVGSEQMHPNELTVARKAVELMFNCLRKKTESDLTLQTLYLPNHEKKLTKSTELVFSDANILKGRVSSLELNYFLGFRDLEIQIMNPIATIAMLSDQYKLLVLSQIVKNALSEASVDTSAPGELSRSIIEVIRSPEFLSGIIRLVNHVNYTDAKSLTKTEAEEIENILLELNIEEVQHLESVLYYRGDLVKDSAMQVPSFMDMEKKMFYIPSLEMNEQTYMHLATAMNNLIGTPLNKDVHIMSRMIQSVPENIETLLDIWEIKMCDYLSSANSDGLTAFPPPGTLIPEEFHSFLDNGFYSFKKGEYVGYEVYDPLIDTDFEVGTSDLTEGVFLVYAIVREIVTENYSPVLARYIIEGKDGSVQEVSGTQLYKIIRGKRTSQSTDMEVSNESPEISSPDNLDLKSVLKEIRETLKKAWDMLCEKDRHRVKKRLYLKWHPDKNPERVDFCTEVCKYIAIYVHRLEQGLDIDESEDDDFSYPAGSSSPDYSWFNQFTARRRRQDEHYQTQKESGSSHSYSFHHFTRSEAYPHPQEARRWLRQAKADLDFAEAALRLSKGFNWVCFMCQQAAEKAIKSVWYNRDSQYADNIRSHDISSIASGLGNPSLAALASRLQNVVRDYNRLRYPDRLAYPRIPSDVEVYSETDANEAYRLAQEIVTLVG